MPADLLNGTDMQVAFDALRRMPESATLGNGKGDIVY